MGLGIVVFKGKKLIKKISEYAGLGTNNTAEYHALIRALQEAKNMGATKVTMIGDSELVIKQVTKEYKTRKKHLKAMRDRVSKLVDKIGDVRFKWVPREKNKIANALAQKALFG